MPINKLRKLADISQLKMSKIIGISYPTYRQKEHSNKAERWKLSEAVKFCEATNHSLEEFMQELKD